MDYIYTSFVDQKVVNTSFYKTKELALDYAIDHLRMSSSGDILSPKLDKEDDIRGFWLYKVREVLEDCGESGDWDVYSQTHEILVARRVLIES